MAERALSEVRPMPPSVMTQVIKLFGEAGQLGRAISLLSVMREEYGLAPNERHLGALIQACRQCGNYEMALALFAQMDRLGIPKNTVVCNVMITTLGEAVQWPAVMDVLGEMTQHGVAKDIITYSAAITACVKAGEWTHAVTLYRLMEAEGVTPNTITLNAVLSACVGGRQLALAREIFADAGRRGVPVDTISYRYCTSFVPPPMHVVLRTARQRSPSLPHPAEHTLARPACSLPCAGTCGALIWPWRYVHRVRACVRACVRA